MEEMIDLERKTKHIEFERVKREIELKLLSPEKGSSQIAVDIAANYILSINSIKCIRQDDVDEFWIYRNGIYLPEGKSYILELCDKLFHVAYTTQKANGVCSKIKVKTFIDSKDFFGQQLLYANIIAVKNGLFNLETKELIPFSADYYFFNKLEMNYNPKASCEKFEEFIKEITSKEEDVKVLQELFGFCLLKDYRYEKGFMFYGSNGRNGKSKVLEVLKKFIGDNNYSGLTLQDIESKPFSLCYLQNKLVNIGSDISNEALKFTGNFKKLTGRDMISADRKNKSYVDFVNYAKMIFTANELPPVTTLSDAFWLRWVIIEFPNQYLTRKEIDALPLDRRDNVYEQDPEKVKNLIINYEGVLNWAVDGLARLIENKDFSNKETAKENHLIWLRRSNSVSAFLYDSIEEDSDCKIKKVDFKKHYLSYCRSNNIKTLNDKVIMRTIESETGATDARYNESVDGFNYSKISYWVGIKFKDINLEVTSVLKEGEITNTLKPTEEYV